MSEEKFANLRQASAAPTSFVDLSSKPIRSTWVLHQYNWRDFSILQSKQKADDESENSLKESRLPPNFEFMPHGEIQSHWIWANLRDLWYLRISKPHRDCNTSTITQRERETVKNSEGCLLLAHNNNSNNNNHNNNCCYNHDSKANWALFLPRGRNTQQNEFEGVNRIHLC